MAQRRNLDAELVEPRQESRQAFAKIVEILFAFEHPTCFSIRRQSRVGLVIEPRAVRDKFRPQRRFKSEHVLGR